jgi:ornithine cyclodeaminase/alanine dehydrogenase-like protein (mu-crystallin family)
VKLLVIDHDTVTEILTLPACIPVMRKTLMAVSAGKGHQPLRTKVAPPGLDGFLGLMPGYIGGSAPALGIKMLGIFPGNSAIGKDSHQGVVMLLDPATGEPQAIVNATAITSIRTAAVSAIATDVLARPDASVLTIIGTGFQAQWHVRAIALVRGLSQVRLTGRDASRGRAVATALTEETGLRIDFVSSTAAALDGADIVVTATTSAAPVLERGWLAPGTHVNAVGACVPSARELDTATVAGSRFVVDRRESALAESGDYLFAATEVGFGPEHVAAELGEILAGTAAARISDDELTVFESLGLAVEDLAAARYVCTVAEDTGRGSVVEF